MSAVVDIERRRVARSAIAAEWGRPVDECWACSRPCAAPQRAHCIPHHLGGPSEPANLMLLCATCHEIQPDLWTREAAERWLRLFSVDDWARWMAFTVAALDLECERQGVASVEELAERTSPTSEWCQRLVLSMWDTPPAEVEKQLALRRPQ